MEPTDHFPGDQQWLHDWVVLKRFHFFEEAVPLPLEMGTLYKDKGPASFKAFSKEGVYFCPLL